MTRHPCHGRTKRQIAVFEQIAVTDHGGHHPATINALLKAGLIEPATPEIFLSQFGPIKVKRYQVSTPIHMQWCQWCDENVKDEDIGNTARVSER